MSAEQSKIQNPKSKILGMGWITPLGAGLDEVWSRLEAGEKPVAARNHLARIRRKSTLHTPSRRKPAPRLNATRACAVPAPSPITASPPPSPRSKTPASP